MVAAAALRAARRRPARAAPRAPALSRRLRFSRAARRERRGAAGARRLVDALPDCVRRRARRNAEAGGSAEEAPPSAKPAQAHATGERRFAPCTRRIASRANAMATRAFIGLGSNLAHPRRQIARALARLAALDGVRVLAVSPNYASAPIGGAPQPDYVNAVALVETTLSPRALLARLHAIERRQRRRRDASTPRNAPRTLDL